MTLTQRIATHLPQLRRYSRAVTGSQAAGDAYIVATLEALIADLTIFPPASSDQVALYKLFSQIMKTVLGEAEPMASTYGWEHRTMANLSRTSRQVFLLSGVEEFSVAEISEILSVSSLQAKQYLEEAISEISRLIATDIMIIEDDSLVAFDIERLATELGHNVTGIARTRKEAVDIFEKTWPKMVLADIQLADGSSGIEAVNDILRVASVPVIFITAYPERLLIGERAEQVFVVTKPYNPDVVKAMISQALFFDQRAKLREKA